MDQTTPRPPLTLGDEIDAIRDVTKALDRLDPAAAMRVCEFVLKRKVDAEAKSASGGLSDLLAAVKKQFEEASESCDCPICTAARERGEQKPMH